MRPIYSQHNLLCLSKADELLGPFQDKIDPSERQIDLRRRHRKIILKIIETIDSEIELLEIKRLIQGSTSNSRKRLRMLVNRKEKCIKLL